MSYDPYDNPDRRQRSDRHYESRRDRQNYVEEEIIEGRGGLRPSRHTALVPRREDSVEEVEREFPPGAGYGQRRPTGRRARSAERSRYDDDDGYYPRQSGRRQEGRKSKRRGQYPSSPSSESPPRRHRRKSLGEQALAALGLGGIAGAVAGDKNRSQDRSRSRDRGRGGDRHRRRSRSYSSSRSRSRSVDQAKKVQQALKAAVIAGATVAMRNRKEPGSWTGEKGRRVLTAAISAGGINELVSKDPDKKGTRHTLEAVAGGLLSNKILNGSRDKSRSRSRSRSRARSRRGDDKGSGLKGLATGGLVAAAGKALYDRARSKSRGRRSSRSSSDSRSPPRHKKRSKSVSEYISRGMGIVGLGENGKDKRRDDRSSRRDRDYDDRYGRDRSPQHARLRGGGGDGGYGVTGESSSSDDDISSGEDRRTKTKMHRKEYLTAGLASVATIHAANSVYKSIDARKKRAKLVKSGVMTEEEAHKLKNKARLQDAAAVGIAAIGIKGAVSEWKEMNEQREKCHEFDLERAERHERRLKRLEDHLASDQHHSYQGASGYDGGPFYEDGNPYRSTASLPMPPIGRHQSSLN